MTRTDPHRRTTQAPPHVVLVPVKPPHRGKSRLGDLPPEQREGLATAFALDVVSAALSTAGVVEVLAVTDDVRLATRIRSLGASAVPDGESDDLNASLVQAAHEAWRRHPDAAVAAVCADLPALRSDDLAAALSWDRGAAAAYVEDASGGGTSLYAADRTELFAPAFGAGSAARHASAGALPVPGDLATLRTDVDAPGDLGRVMVLGVGAHTAAAMGLSSH